MCVLAALGLAYSLYPYVVLDRLTVWEAAAATGLAEVRARRRRRSCCRSRSPIRYSSTACFAARPRRSATGIPNSTLVFCKPAQAHAARLAETPTALASAFARFCLCLCLCLWLGLFDELARRFFRLRLFLRRLAWGRFLLGCGFLCGPFLRCWLAGRRFFRGGFLSRRFLRCRLRWRGFRCGGPVRRPRPGFGGAGFAALGGLAAGCAGALVAPAAMCSAKKAPCGSMSCAMRSPPGTSIGPCSSEPRAAFAWATVASRSVTLT